MSIIFSLFLINLMSLAQWPYLKIGKVIVFPKKPENLMLGKFKIRDLKKYLIN